MKKIVLIYTERYIERIDEKKSDLQEEGSVVYTVHEDNVEDLVKQLEKIYKCFFTKTVSSENKDIFSKKLNAQEMS